MREVQLQSGPNTIVAKVYESENFQDKVIIISSATGTPQSYYKRFAQFMSTHGFAVITFDYSGVALSAPKQMKGYKSSLVHWGKYDLTAVIEYAQQNFPNAKLYHVGQSIAGQVLLFCPKADVFEASVQVACQTGDWNLWPWYFRFILFFNWHILRWITNTFGYFPGKRLGIMEDLPKGVGLDWSYSGLDNQYLPNKIENKDEQLAAIKKLPVIAYSFTDDRTAPLKSVKSLHALYRSEQLTHHHIRPKDFGIRKIGHFGFFREKCKMFWKEIAEAL